MTNGFALNYGKSLKKKNNKNKNKKKKQKKKQHINLYPSNIELNFIFVDFIDMLTPAKTSQTKGFLLHL